jgi:hypothetical protein
MFEFDNWWFSADLYSDTVEIQSKLSCFRRSSDRFDSLRAVSYNLREPLAVGDLVHEQRPKRGRTGRAEYGC